MAILRVMKNHRAGQIHALYDVVYADVDPKQKRSLVFELYANGWHPMIQFPWEKKK